MTTNNIDIPTLEQIENIIESDEILRNYYYQSVLRKQTHIHPVFQQHFDQLWTGKSKLDFKLFSDTSKVWKTSEKYILVEVLETSIRNTETLYSGRMILATISDIKATPTNLFWHAISLDQTYNFKIPEFHDIGFMVKAPFFEPKILPEYVLFKNNIERLGYVSQSVENYIVQILSVINSRVSNEIPYNEKRHESITAEIKWFLHQFIQFKIEQTNGQNN